MPKISELLDAAKLAHKLPSDYALAKTLEISKQAVSEYRKGTRQPDNFTLTRLASLLERDPLEVIAEVEADVAKTEARRSYWQNLPSGLKHTLLGGLAWFLTGGISNDVGSAYAREMIPSSDNERLRQPRTGVDRRKGPERRGLCH